MMKRLVLCLTTVFLSLFVFQNSLASDEPVSTGRFNNSAIGKHDVMAYHESKVAVKGEKTFVHIWKGAEWHFATEEHRNLFAANPEKYSPAYNGFCSNALSLGEGLIRTNGQVWHIWNGRLHTFYAKRGLERWLANDYAQLAAEADRAWQQELAKRQN